MKNQEIAKIFTNLATYLYMEDVPFKPQAYEKSSESIAAMRD